MHNNQVVRRSQLLNLRSDDVAIRLANRQCRYGRGIAGERDERNQERCNSRRSA